MKGKMKAQVFYEPEVMRLEEVQIPEPRFNEVLIKVRACGVCGSDLAYFFGDTPLENKTGKGPMIMGHEFCGEIAELGAGVEEMGLFKVGDRVIANPVQNCNACPQCMRKQVNLCKNVQTKGTGVDGAYAEYATVRYTHVYKMPDHMTYEQGAICEPLACAVNGVGKLDIQIGDQVVLFGPGNIGIMMIQLMKAKGAVVTAIGPIDYGLEKALEFGADYVINNVKKESVYYTDNLVGKVSEITEGELANKVIVATAAKPALQQALEVSGMKAVITYFGMPASTTVLEVPLLDFQQKDKTIHVSWLAPYTWDEAMKALSTGKVKTDGMVTHRWHLEELEEAIRFMKDPDKEEKIKSIILFP